jgi:16S rRNA (uracil1498-N3)-methyltransferase
MSITRLFSPVSLQTDAFATLGGEQARYVGKVLRLHPGDSLHLFDGRGSFYKAEIISLHTSQLVVKVGARVDKSVESPLAVHLLQCVSRGERMDFVVQKATELGVCRITPVLSEFSVVKLDAARAEKRLQHWVKIAISACEQCGRNTVPDIAMPSPLRDWFAENSAAHDTNETRIALKPGAGRNLYALGATRAQLTLLVGPEGGLSDAEYAQSATCGFTAVAMGPRILRTETAAIATIAALQTLYGDLCNPQSVEMSEP